MSLPFVSLMVSAMVMDSRGALVRFGGLQAGDARLTDTRQDEQDRCITIKSTGNELNPVTSLATL